MVTLDEAYRKEDSGGSPPLFNFIDVTYYAHSNREPAGRPKRLNNPPCQKCWYTLC